MAEHDGKVNISGRWTGYYNDDKENKFWLSLDQERKDESLEGSDVNGSKIYTRLNKSSDLGKRHIIFCVVNDKGKKDCRDGCKDFKGVISVESSRIVGIYEKDGQTVGTFTMEKRIFLTMDNINIGLRGQWTGCYDDDKSKTMTLNLDIAKLQPNGAIGDGVLIGIKIVIILRSVDFHKHEMIVCVPNARQPKCEGDCTDFVIAMVSESMIQGKYESPDGKGTFRLNKKK